MYISRQLHRHIIAIFVLTLLGVVSASSPGLAAPSASVSEVAGEAGASGDAVSADLARRSEPSRDLSIEARVEYQRRIEEVHWRHTTWPEANPRPKPPLAEVMPEAALRRKVDDALRKSAALEAYWQRPISAEQLQAEMERMARGTRHPEMLRELFAALDDDPFVIAECLARPALADRLLRNRYAYDERLHREVRAAAESALAGGVTASDLASVAARYEEVVLERERDAETADPEALTASPGETRALRLDPEEWAEEIRRLAGRLGLQRPTGPADDETAALLAATPLDVVGTLEESEHGWSVVTVLAKGEQAVRMGIAHWPKVSFSSWWSAARDEQDATPPPLAGAYTLPTVSVTAGCTPDSWRTEEGPPLARSRHTAVWTGDRMIVWGGYGNSYQSTGGVYDPATDSWTPTSLEGAPAARSRHTAVWTGDRMIVWGGFGGRNYLNTGGVYDPATDSWTPTSLDGAPSVRDGHTAVWTGDRMIVWGGYDSSYQNTGGVYDPATGSWTPTSLEGAPAARTRHTAVWTGDRMIVWGGSNLFGRLKTGGVYDPATDSWTPTSVDGAPSGRDQHTAVWTGDRMIVWGEGGNNNTGGVYDPATDSWTPTSVDGAAPARWNHTAVWTGDRMIVWGGSGYTLFPTGGVYDPATDSWTPTSLEGAPSGRDQHTAVWTGDRMIVWGGFGGGYQSTGGVYDPATDSWTPTSVDGAPSARSSHTAVWTGDRMIVWGGSGGGNTGGVYDPATDSWTPTSLDGAPSARAGHTAVWTGDRMIVWGGGGNNNTGGVYDPATDSWTSTSLDAALQYLEYHTAVWTGDRMIVWGARCCGSGYTLFPTGGVYDPATDSWTPTSVDGAPSARIYHTAVWTGDRMIVWGSNPGGVYDPATDSWTPTSVDGAPSARIYHTAVWTDDRMIVWGGSGGGNTGGVYDPATDSWTPTSLDGAPSARYDQTAVWTDDRMIVWGGNPDTNTGGVYDPATDSWTPTSVDGAPSARQYHTAVYTGSEMLIWGGEPLSNQLGAYCAAPDQGPGAGRIPDASLRIARTGTDLALSWSAACGGGDDYAVYEGVLGVEDDFVSRTCTTGGATSAALSPSEGSRSYVVVPLAGGNEGSYGQSSDGAERSPAVGACAPQIVNACP